MGNDSWGGVFENFFEKTKISSQFIEQRGDVFEKILSCNLYSIDFPKMKIY